MTLLHRFFFAHKIQTGGALTLNPILGFSAVESLNNRTFEV